MRICTGGGFVGIRRHDLVRSVGDVISKFQPASGLRRRGRVSRGEACRIPSSDPDMYVGRVVGTVTQVAAAMEKTTGALSPLFCWRLGCPAQSPPMRCRT